MTLLLLALACVEGAQPPLPTMELDIRGHSITVEVADSQEECMRGWMFRGDPRPDEGMLFVYSEPVANLRFWMKDTVVPLSIAFVDAQGVIVHTAELEPGDLEGATCPYPVLYAIEMGKLWFPGHAVGPGEAVEGLPR